MTADIAALSPSVQRMPGEDFTSYFLRLFDNRLTYGLTCSQVADLLNAESGQPEYSESKWRKDYKLYVRARNYEEAPGLVLWISRRCMGCICSWRDVVGFDKKRSITIDRKEHQWRILRA